MHQCQNLVDLYKEVWNCLHSYHVTLSVFSLTLGREKRNTGPDLDVAMQWFFLLKSLTGALSWYKIYEPLAKVWVVLIYPFHEVFLSSSNSGPDSLYPSDNNLKWTVPLIQTATLIWLLVLIDKTFGHGDFHCAFAVLFQGYVGRPTIYHLSKQFKMPFCLSKKFQQSSTFLGFCSSVSCFSILHILSSWQDFPNFSVSVISGWTMLLATIFTQNLMNFCNSASVFFTNSAWCTNNLLSWQFSLTKKCFTNLKTNVSL